MQEINVSFRGIIEMKDEQLYEPIHAILQHVCTKVVDKADYRVHTSEAIQSILLSLPQSQRPRFLKFLQRFSKNSKVSFNLISTRDNLILNFCLVQFATLCTGSVLITAS